VPTAPDFAPPLGHRTGLDGIRALAVLMVAGVHTQPRLVPGGSIGVDVFFVLSGFLITTLLVEELDRRDRISFGRFYARRALRLFPALLALLAVVMVWALFVASPGTRHDALREVLAAVTYTRNLPFWADVPGPLLGHTWSLAVEEQFYLLWPLVLILVVRPRRSAARAIVGFLMIVVLFGALRAGGLLGPGLLFVLRPDALLLGAALALTRRERPELLDRTASWGLPAVVTGTVGLLALAVWDGADDIHSVGFSLAALCAAVLIAGLLVADGEGVAGWFDHRWVVAMGKVSYGFYLWHMPVLRWTDDRLVGQPAVVRIPLGLALAMVATMASYRFVEVPALRWKDRFRPPGVSENGQIASLRGDLQA
jgi:peptidoglycan/LPS O-acetylase OafA/YrhL